MLGIDSKLRMGILWTVEQAIFDHFILLVRAGLCEFSMRTMPLVKSVKSLTRRIQLSTLLENTEVRS